MLAAATIDRFCPPLDDAEAGTLPPEIQASLTRHRQNLVTMVAALEAVGLGDTAIEIHLSAIVGSYRAELSAALHHLGNRS